MSIKLLLDENLSERLLPLLSEAFPGSTPIRLLGLGGVDDRAVWDEARSSGSVLLTKDDDFSRHEHQLGMAAQGDLPGDWQCLQCGDRTAHSFARL